MRPSGSTTGRQQVTDSAAAQPDTSCQRTRCGVLVAPAPQTLAGEQSGVRIRLTVPAPVRGPLPPDPSCLRHRYPGAGLNRPVRPAGGLRIGEPKHLFDLVADSRPSTRATKIT